MARSMRKILGNDGSAKQLKVIAAGLTDAGRQRDNNEDSFLALDQLQAPLEIGALLVVADGMGGHVAGEIASRTVVDVLGNVFGSSPKRSQQESVEDLLFGAVQAANVAIREKVESNHALKGMGTTLTAVAVHGSIATIAHVGDSRAYQFSKGQLTQLTRDHSWVAEQVMLGLMTPEEARVHPDRNVVTRAVGLNANVKAELATAVLPRHSLLVLCSDGLHDVVLDDEISTAANAEKDPFELCKRLVDLANERGGPDNITVVAALMT